MIVIVDNIRSALNLGSIIRTSDALGIKEIYLCGITPEPLHPKVTKTSLGAERNIRFHRFGTTEEAITHLKKLDYQIIALELSANASELSSVKPKTTFAIVIGNEVAGISESVLGLVDKTAKIEMKGVKESLNVSVAFGIAAYIFSQKEVVSKTSKG